MKLKLECDVCGKSFKSKAEDRYTCRKEIKLLQEPKLFDAFDCPRCGCQIIAGRRLRLYDDSEEFVTTPKISTAIDFDDGEEEDDE